MGATMSQANVRSVDAVRDFVRRVGWLADALPEVAEIDVNPLVVGSDAALAVDVRVRICPPLG